MQFTAAASQIQGVPWPPFMTEALTQSATVFAGVMNGKQTLQTAFKNFQNVLVNYAKALDATPAAQAAAAAADEPAEAGFLVGSAPNGMARIDPHTPVKPGGRVTFTVDPARLCFFDPDTGQAITG